MALEKVEYQGIENSIAELKTKSVELLGNLNEFKREAQHFGEAGDAVAGGISGVAIEAALNKVATQIEDFLSKCHIMMNLMNETSTKFREQEEQATNKINAIINN